MTERVLERLVRAAEARAERLAAEPDPGPPDGEPPSFRDAIGGRDALSVIAEFKRKSPSAGAIRDDDPGARALAYREAGASAVSVLTDPDGFGGSLTDLQTASAASGLPILMKDFVVDPAQVRAGWAAGASAVLLIVRCLDDARLRRLHREARSLGLDTLVEVHDAAELDRALALEDAIVGINNRDLDTLETDRRRARGLLPRIPSGRIAVAESGYLEPDHLTELRGRADAVLIGTALMRAADPSAFLRAATEPVPAGV
ncbi:MAG: indole-3-glycerol-phosphate synthase [Acidobacteria bacterium]|nr:indole-3-glycerol-phosphate synthase [Acidobacteriota bacterium]MYH21271.1 indole-3-glycerol-phosphate synthase [Acidobacteriota bacterium]MYK78194.1 indole-3-glycerol-phosphate synthase [Acidobacteriota bacterium]